MQIPNHKCTILGMKYQNGPTPPIHPLVGTFPPRVLGLQRTTQAQVCRYHNPLPPGQSTTDRLPVSEFTDYISSWLRSPVSSFTFRLGFLPSSQYHPINNNKEEITTTSQILQDKRNLVTVERVASVLPNCLLDLISFFFVFLLFLFSSSSIIGNKELSCLSIELNCHQFVCQSLRKEPRENPLRINNPL